MSDSRSKDSGDTPKNQCKHLIVDSEVVQSSILDFIPAQFKDSKMKDICTWT